VIFWKCTKQLLIARITDVSQRKLFIVLTSTTLFKNVVCDTILNNFLHKHVWKSLPWNIGTYYNNNNNNKLQLGCHPVAVVILHVYKIWNFTGLHDITSKKTSIIVTAILNNKSQIFNLLEWNVTEYLSTQSILDGVYCMSLWWQLRM